MRSTLLLAAMLALACAAAPGASPNHDALLDRATVTNENDLLQRRSHGALVPSTALFEQAVAAKNVVQRDVRGGWSGWTACTKQCGGGTRSHTCTNPVPERNLVNRRRYHNPMRQDALDRAFRSLTCVLADGSTNWKIIPAATNPFNGNDVRKPVISAQGPYKTDWCKGMYTGFTSNIRSEGSGCNGEKCAMPAAASSIHGATESVPCNTHPCAVNGGWSTYGGWTDCSKKCGGGTKFRTRSCSKPKPSGGGADCGRDDTDTVSCNTQSCAVDCVYKTFSAWTTCTTSCAAGSQRRSRVVTQAQFGGKACAHTAETRACNHGPCPIHCATSAFSAWTPCTKSCGAGAQSRSRAIATRNLHGGYVCPYLAETRDCNAQSCATDCVTNDWAAWSTCTKSCGTGSQQRSRTQVEATLGGKSCPHYAETRACNTAGCATDCKVAAPFGAWATCTVSCSGGSQQRTRAVVAPTNGGVACPHSAETRACGMRACPIDGGWSAFGSCNKFCGSGSQSRTCTNPAPRYGGASCAGSATGACNTAVCPKAPTCSVLANGETVVHYTDTPSFKCSHTKTTCTCSVSGHPTHHKGGCKQVDHTNGKTLSFAGDCTSTGKN